MTAEATEHVGESQGMENHDHDMIHDLSLRLDALWRYDQYIANAKGNRSLIAFWKKLKDQESKNIKSLKTHIASHAKKGCF